MTYADDREALLDQMTRTHLAYLQASEWARALVEIAPQSGCHLAALGQVLRANRLWVDADEALEDYDSDAPQREWHEAQARRLMAGPSEAQIEASLARMDRLFGPGWLEQ